MKERPRLWPLGFVLGLALSWLAWVWLGSDLIRQMRILQTLATAMAALLLALVWLVFWSRLPGRVRLAGLLAVVGALGSAAALFRIRGVSGDFVPILAPRWEEPAVRPVVPKPVPVASAPSRPAPRKAERPSPPADYAQFLGPTRNGVVRGVRLARDWSARPPQLMWRQPIGAAWSSFAVAGDQAVTQEQRGEDELVVSYSLESGAIRWVHADRVRYATVVAGEGPRATPTIAGGQVFTMGGTGVLNAFDLASGVRLWSQVVSTDSADRNPQWGRSGSPLVVDDVVVVSAGGAEGGSLVAYRQDTGQRAWSGGSDRASYSSPLLTELAGQRQIVIFNHASVAGHDPSSGAVLWEHPWPHEQPNVAQPLPLPGDRLLVSTGYGIGSKLLRISRSEGGGFLASLVWESPRLKSKFANFVLQGGFVYGLDDGVMTCLDPATGERRWKGGRYGHGQVLLVEDLLLVQTEEGEVVLLEPDPGGPKELARFPVLEGKSWNPPALAGRHLLVRNDREAACYELPLAE